MERVKDLRKLADEAFSAWCRKLDSEMDQEIYDALTESPDYKRKRFILTGPQVTAEEHEQLKAAFREVAQR